MERDFKGIWVPKEVWLDKELSWIEKFLLVEIDSLDNEEGCWASNEYFSKFFGVSKDRISKLISGLMRKGYLTVQLVYKEGTKTIDKRIVRITYRYRRKYLEGVGGSADTPIGENTEENNTSFNNTKNIYSAFEKAWKEYPTKKGKNAVNKKNKEAIEKLGEEKILQAVRNYTKDIAHQRANGFKDLNYMNGSTFFNGRYEEYLDSSSITPLERSANNNGDINYYEKMNLGTRL